MTLSINNPISSTYIFISILLIALIFSYKKTREKGLSITHTQELKGFAILAIVFSHIGYFLSEQHDFLFPLSIFAGVGVNLFLFLSGYGLTISALKRDESIFQFYKRKVSKLLIPFWITLGAFLTLDFFVLHITYTREFIVKAFFGIFQQANIFNDLNSPFWYMTLILFYYILYPILFSKKYPWATAGVLYIITYYILKSEPEFLKDVLTLYKVHLLAFPLGIASAWFFVHSQVYKNIVQNTFLIKVKEFALKIRPVLYYISVFVLVCVISYFSIHSGVGESPQLEQKISIFVTASLILLFILKKNEYRLLTILGIYSYEIYLLHWPIMYRYNFLYTYMPAWLATALYIILFLGLGWGLKHLSKKIAHISKI